MASEHAYALTAEWTGNRAGGTTGYRDYGRNVVLRIDGKPDLLSSADTAFRGDPDRWNPEELLLAALSQCHLLSYLHVASANGIVVVDYTDAATGVMQTTADGGGRFTSATLRPIVTISAGDPALALELHHEASTKCFIASSVNFPVGHEPTIVVAQAPIG